MNTKKLQEALEFAKANALTSIQVGTIKMDIPQETKPTEVKIQTDDELKKIFGADADVTSEYSDEELLYYATPYFDELQAKKKLRQEALLQEKQVRDDKDVNNG